MCTGLETLRTDIIIVPQYLDLGLGFGTELGTSIWDWTLAWQIIIWINALNSKTEGSQVAHGQCNPETQIDVLSSLMLCYYDDWTVSFPVGSSSYSG